MADINLKDVLLTPEEHYETPASVSADARWTKDQKIKILRAWKTNEEALLRAADAGMDGGERPHLKLVAEELKKMEDI
jgi:hypothetical protein